MAIRILTVYLLMFIIVISSIESAPLMNENFIENYPSSNIDNVTPSMTQRVNFIAYLCQRKEEYSLKLQRKLCSKYIQLYKIQEVDDDNNQGEQRSKRVGWTISV